jgi:hypothetical protein
MSGRLDRVGCVNPVRLQISPPGRTLDAPQRACRDAVRRCVLAFIYRRDYRRRFNTDPVTPVES